MRLLVVEDNQELLKPLVSGLKRAGYAVDQCADGTNAQWMIKSNPYDLVVLDIMLPGSDGYAVLKTIRDAAQSTRVLFLTAKDTTADRVHGLRSGADDYLVKPFAFDELLARIEALLRRGDALIPRVIQLGPVEIHLHDKTVTRHGDPLKLSPREFAILEYLATRRGKIVSRTEIEEHVYDSQVEPMSNVVDSAICAIRRKISSEDESIIQTRRGMGYIVPSE